MRLPRASGILLHPTSLPGRFGIGDFGDEAFRFVDYLKRCGQTHWQILPLVPTGWGDSPYSSFSAFAGNPLLISPQGLAADGLVPMDVIDNAPEFESGRVDYGGVYGWKKWLLQTSFETFSSDDHQALSAELDWFCVSNAWWLEDYALFLAIKDAQGGKPWFEWPEQLKLRDEAALDGVANELSTSIRAEQFTQFLFARQWQSVKGYANQNGISIIGDVPIFVALDSADVWCNQSQFKLNEDASPIVVSGVPPDYFSKTGQRWGNPIYDWEAMMAERFGWWISRMSYALTAMDIIRIDHFIGFRRMYEVPAMDETAENGQWGDVPGHQLFSALRDALGRLPFIAEDLGAITPEVEELRDAFGLPGMRILQYGFGGNPHDTHLPHSYVQNCVAYTGTHDNDTAAGWYRSASKEQKRLCKKYLHASPRDMHWSLVRAVLASVADTAIIPMQDILGLGSEARTNTPAGHGPNWQWRLNDGDMRDDTADALREMVEFYGRVNGSWQHTD
ncbi:MAG: 4-alpha-glucanotransferase [Pyrinomonadaceae bacterium]